MKITPREKRRHAAKFSLPAACRLFSRGVIFTRARVSLALLSLRKNGGLLVVYLRLRCLSLRRTPFCFVLFSIKARELELTTRSQAFTRKCARIDYFPFICGVPWLFVCSGFFHLICVVRFAFICSVRLIFFTRCVAFHFVVQECI